MPPIRVSLFCRPSGASSQRASNIRMCRSISGSSSSSSASGPAKKDRTAGTQRRNACFRRSMLAGVAACSFLWAAPWPWSSTVLKRLRPASHSSSGHCSDEGKDDCHDALSINVFQWPPTIRDKMWSGTHTHSKVPPPRVASAMNSDASRPIFCSSGSTLGRNTNSCEHLTW